MRLFHIAMLLLATLAGLRAEDYRKWTEDETKQQIKAKMISKNLDGSEAKLLMLNGKIVSMSKSRLIAKDQDYFENWVDPEDHISARVVGSGKGWKSVKIAAVAGNNSLVVKVFWRDSGKQPKGYPKVYKLKKGQEKTFTCKVSNDYKVQGFSGKKLVDEERWNKKTGL